MSKTTYNLTAIKNVSRNKPELFNNMIYLFIENSTNELKNLEQDILTNNAENVRTTIHKIKPSFAYLGLSELIDDLNNLRDSVINNNKELTTKLLDDFKTNLNNVIDKLKTEII